MQTVFLCRQMGVTVFYYLDDFLDNNFIVNFIFLGIILIFQL